MISTQLPKSSRNPIWYGLLAAVGWGVTGAGCSSNASTAEDVPKSAAIDPALHYESTVYLEALNEQVTILKTPRDVLVQRSDGRLMTYADVVRDEEGAAKARFGNFSPAFERYLATLPDEQVIPISVHYILPTGVKEKVGSMIAHSQYAAAQALQRLAISEAAPSAALHLAAMGFEEHRRANLLPILTGFMTVRRVRELKFNHTFAYIAGDEPGKFSADSVPNAQDVSGIYDTFNANSEYASGVRVGMIDQGTCRLYDGHESLTEITGSGVNYQEDPSLSCSTDTDCNICGTGSKCMSGLCVGRHSTKVGSVIASYKGGTWFGAAQAKLYFANGSGYPFIYDTGHDSVACSVDGIVHAYDWFSDISHNVHIVNESYHCRSVPTKSSYVDGREADFAGDDYARIADILVTKSAGNQDTSVNEEACPYAMNNLCVGGVTSSLDMACFSSWRNPGYWSTQTDREEPDLVAFAGAGTNGYPETAPGYCDQTAESVELALLTGTTSWQSAGDVSASGNGHYFGTTAGTSFAAPAIASLAALLKSGCSNASAFNHLEMRAMLRSAAYSANPDGNSSWRYSTPGKGEDFKDGAGFVRADAALGVCNGEGPNGVIAKVGGGTIDTKDGDEPPAGECLYGCSPLGPPPSSAIKPLGTASPGSSTRYVHKLDGLSLSVGDRVRVSIAWDACGGEERLSNGLASIKPDFDLFLYHKTSPTSGEYIYTSQSVGDNNEGFDLVIPTGKAGDYDIYIAYPKNAPACSGTEEAYGWSWVVIPA